MSRSYGNPAGFGKHAERQTAGRMPKEGVDVHMPLVDNNAIDAATRRGDGSSIEVQIKTRSKRRRPVCDDRSQAAGRLV